MMLSPNRYPHYFLLLVAFAAILSATGCAPPLVSATSTIHADGSFRRSLTYQSEFNADKGGATRCDPTVTGTDMAGLVTLPKSDGGWVLTARQDRKGHRQINVSRTVSPGEPLVGDLGVLALAKPGQAQDLQFTNRVTVKRIGPHQIEYRETLWWRGAKPALLLRPDPAVRSILLKTLPQSERLHTAAIDRVTVAVQRILCSLYSEPNQNREALGPNVPQAAQQKMMRKILHAELESPEFASACQVQADSQETSRIADLAVNGYMRATIGTTSENSSNTNSFNFDSPHFTFTAHMPAKITATNGQLLHSNGGRDVTWSLSTNVIALGDVTLTATCEIPVSSTTR